jgi:hypothetical protein
MSMISRRPGHAVMERVLLEQQQARPRTRFERLIGLNVLTPSARSWYAGALGELQVGRMLGRLPAGWHVWHALPVGTGETDIDHLVVGPSGIFPINSKNHRGRVWLGARMLMVNGQKTAHLRASAAEGRRIAKLVAPLGVPADVVRPVICLVNPAQFTVKQWPSEVTVATSSQLLAALAHQPTRVDPHTVSRVAVLFDSPATWRVHDMTSDPWPLFQYLQTEVDAARTRRLLWAVGIVLGAGPAMFGFSMLMFGAAALLYR